MKGKVLVWEEIGNYSQLVNEHNQPYQTFSIQNIDLWPWLLKPNIILPRHPLNRGFGRQSYTNSLECIYIISFHSIKNMIKQENIPVGCILRTCQAYIR